MVASTTILSRSNQDLFNEAKRLHENMKHLDYSMNECAMFAPFTLRINQLKKEKNAIVLAHNYQRPEILFGVADFIGDSFALSEKAKNTDVNTILFCGVHFMAETAKILNPSKKVLIPSLQAGCSLAESIRPQDVRQLKEKFPQAKVITYVNTSADVKAESDVCCTSANALKVIEQTPGSEVIFLPDKFMAQNLQKQTKKKIHYWNGVCIVHETFSASQILAYKKQYPDLVVLSHLECAPEVIEVSDMAGGTSDMYNYIKNSSAKRFMLVTECGMSDLLKQRFPEKEFINPCSICPYMKKINLENIQEALEKEQFEVIVPGQIRARAQKALDRMLEIGK
ncbi:MAG TPA: quinolinate synthase NadA [archaeon]|nr:quinolinate synthase NadA [archaeon]